MRAAVTPAGRCSSKHISSKYDVPVVTSQSASRRLVRAAAEKEGGTIIDRIIGTLRLPALVGTIRLGGTKVVGRGGPSRGDTIFVAGATGRLGSRVVFELLRMGFRVRAGVREVTEVQEYIERFEELGALTSAQMRNLELIRFDLTDPSTFARARGGCKRVVFAAAYSGPVSNPGGFTEIDGKATVAFIEHCRDSTIPLEHFILVTSLGTATPLKWPFILFNLLGGLLFWKKKAEETLRTSGIPFTIIRPGGMEKPTDSWGDDHYLVLGGSGQIDTGVVSRLQVAQLIGAAVQDREVAANKVLEVVTAEGSMEQDLGELMSAVAVAGPSLEEQAEARDGRMELVKQAEELDEEVEDAEKTIESARARLAEIAEEVKAIAQEEAAIRSDAGEDLAAVDAAQAEVAALQARVEELTKRDDAGRALIAAVQKAGREGRVLSEAEKKEVVDAVINAPSKEELARMEAERKKKEEEERRARAEEERRARAEEAKRQREEAERKRREAAEEAKRQAEARQKAAAEAKDKAEAEKKKAAAEAKAKAEASKKVEAPKAEAPKKVEAPKAEAPKKVEAPKAAEAKPSGPMAAVNRIKVLFGGFEGPKPASGAVSEYGLAIPSRRAEPAIRNVSVEEAQKEARAWIATWKTRSGKGGAKAPAKDAVKVPAKPVTPAAAPAKAAAAKGAVSEYGLAISTNRAEPPLNNKSVEENKAEAKKWIAAWKSRATKPKVLSLF